MRSKSPMNHSSKRRSRSNSISSSRKALFAKNDKLNESSPFQGGRKKKMLINIGNIQVNTSHDRSGFSTSQGPQFNSIGYRHSLNYSMRKREQAKQIEDNIMMLKKIHFAEPSIKLQYYKDHEKNTEKLKRQISTGASRQAMMQAARDMIISREINKIKKDKNIGTVNESGKRKHRASSAMSQRGLER